MFLKSLSIIAILCSKLKGKLLCIADGQILADFKKNKQNKNYQNTFSNRPNQTSQKKIFIQKQQKMYSQIHLKTNLPK